MARGLPKTKTGTPGKNAGSICIQTYFAAKRMESVGMLRPGQALMLAAALSAAKGKRK